MTFLTEIDRVAGLVERRLAALLDQDAATTQGAEAGAPLAEAMRYAALGGGKRLRPFLLIKAAGLFGVPEEASLDAACALECVHCYSLVHDDLPAMDDDALRRGRPTVHIAFDEATAILTGDSLLTVAFEIVSAPHCHGDPAVRAELVHLLAKASGWHGMALGQALDLAAERRRFSPEDTAAMQRLKTGALFRFACEAGAVLGRGRAASREALLRYANAFGQAFQLADDLLDTHGDAAAMGKAVSKDAERGKATLVGLLGVAEAKARLAGLVAEAEEALTPFGSDAAVLIEAAHFVAERRT
ncbi:farnesyl diphosphate synthase [Methyloceanibacter sp.]|uniref:polyprenyl synthetase family protein n=1 Tax=Methyloceanibacter sp. TaxID=1965321 RepID=UPI002C9A981D|nr:farnesyl diphosphate synthase [Methyloceanibacter sp.]HML93136.1 polyprenyl synthetase family protein [Methyloceanibacter sp.]